jgi:hypothetical protein
MSDSELRQRQPSPTTPPKAPLNYRKGSIPPPSNQPPATTATRGFILAASLVLSVILLLYLRNFHSLSPASSYILCSPPGTQRIYTVDNDKSEVECMAVSGNLIVDTGAHGMSHECTNLFRTPFMAHFPQPTSQADIHHTN